MATGTHTHTHTPLLATEPTPSSDESLDSPCTYAPTRRPATQNTMSKRRPPQGKPHRTEPIRPQAFGIHPECPGPFPCRKWVEPQSPERTEKQLSKRPTKRRLSKSQKQSPPTRFRQVNTPTRQIPVPSIHQNRAHRLDSNQPRGKISSPGLGQTEYRPAGAPRTR